MDLFVDNLDKIRKVVEFIVRDYHYRYEVNELVNTAYISYRTAIKNNPSLVYSQFNNIHVLINRVRFDIRDYVREQRKLRVIEKMERAGIEVPLFCSTSFQSYDEDDKIAHVAPPDNREDSFEESDTKDTLDYIMNNSGLTAVEKEVIYSRYAVGKTIKETANIMGRSPSGINDIRKSAMEKIQSKVERERLVC